MTLLLFPLGCQGGDLAVEGDYVGTRLLRAQFPHLHVRQTIKGSSFELAFTETGHPAQLSLES